MNLANPYGGWGSDSFGYPGEETVPDGGIFDLIPVLFGMIFSAEASLFERIGGLGILVFAIGSIAFMASVGFAILGSAWESIKSLFH